MRGLVTGATGFLGSWVVRALLQAGDRPRALVRSLPHALAGLPVDLVVGDVLDRASVKRALAGMDAVIHVAGLVSLRRRDRELLQRVNVEGTRLVIGLAAERGVRAIHTSTIATIGFTEEPRLADEESRLSPEAAALYPYAASKLAAEEVALSIARGGAQVVVLNPGLLLGPGDLRLSSTRFVHHY